MLLTPTLAIEWAFAGFIACLFLYVLVSVTAYLFFDIVKGAKREELVRFQPWLVTTLLVVVLGGLGDLLHVSVDLNALGQKFVVSPSVRGVDALAIGKPGATP